jgi:hypothetical protein
MEQLDSVHIAIMAGDEPGAHEMVQVPTQNPSVTTGMLPAHKTHPRLGEIGHLRPGEWLHWHDGERESRCRLVENDREKRYLLLGNLSGIRVARLDYHAAAEALDAAELRLIDKTPVFDRLLALALGDWKTLLDKRAQLLAQTLRERQIQEAREHAQARERARRQAEALDEEKQRKEAEQRALEEAEAACRTQREALEKAISQRTLEMRRLQPGAMVELINEQDRPMTCQLALVLRSTRKMVFVDHIGRRVAELRPEELAARVVEGSAQVRDYGVAFDEKLHQLIKQRSDAMPDG